MMETTKENTTIDTMPTKQAERPGETTINSPPMRQWGMLEDHLLTIQYPMPGQQGAPCFRGKEILKLLRNWERMANKYRLSTVTKIKSMVDYFTPDMKTSVNALNSMAEREVWDETKAM